MSYKDKDKQREYQRKWVANRRKEWLDINGPCVLCNSNDRLEVDHVDPSQKVTHAIWTWSKERRDAELAKCQVLCYDCHLEKTLRERPPAPHGKDQRYDLGCRCNLCKAFKSRKNAKRIR